MSEFENLTAPPPPPSGSPGAEEKQWGMFGHLSALTGVVTGGLGNFLGPLIVWQMKKDTLPFAADQAKEALNFNITLLIVGVVFGVIGVIFTAITLGLGAILVVPVALALGVAWLVFTIMAAMKANDGVAYRYPLTIRLIK
jgi:hypothetical protein